MVADANLLSQVRVMADYQFGKGSGNVLFPDDVSFMLSRTKRVRQVLSGKSRIATVRAKDGVLTLSIEAASMLHSFLPFPRQRVVICEDAVPFVSKGKTAFAKHVLELDPELRSGEEVLVVDEQDKLLAAGQLLLAVPEIIVMDSGAAVDVRVGIEK
ncbi:uncharacterized protein with predicted RNA binding PUA domain [Methanohalophilus levihalophilus]|uniref:PUA domain-containing protein n=1 Tax=Methanohalophilus levihalophilus TaxID=1431282 RepID=UPI001AEA87A8|nr:PUA domain-containing protein [Methanohalophilus levihalophilus]MBP2030385.1 uncharacterized protein with predicted RNA binding PUA domain [Methanohalophilus levihalophilus]